MSDNVIHLLKGSWQISNINARKRFVEKQIISTRSLQKTNLDTKTNNAQNQ